MMATMRGAAALTVAMVMGAGPVLAAPAATAPAKAVVAPVPAAASAPAAAAVVEFGGPSIPGVCLLSQQALLADSKLGAATNEKLQHLRDRLAKSVADAKAALNAQAKTLAAQRATLPVVQFEQRENVLNQKAQALQAQAEEKSQQFQATGAKAQQAALEAAKPVIADVYRNRGCGVLLDRAAVLAGGIGMDLTASVIQALDAKITTPPEF